MKDKRCSLTVAAKEFKAAGQCRVDGIAVKAPTSSYYRKETCPPVLG